MPADASHLPHPRWAGRIAEYLRAMFPPHVHAASGALMFLAVDLSLQATAGLAPLRLGPRALAGAATVILLALLMRVQDELKDADTDEALARAGDARFTSRPLVRGRVTREDLARLRRSVLVLLLALNAPLGFPWPLAAFGVALGVVLLSGRWFFWPRVRRDLLLAFATHNPIALLVAAYAAAVFAADFGAAGIGRAAAPVVLAMWLAVAAWEVGRKLRAPEDETAYSSWSSRLGFRRAAALVALLATASGAGFAVAALRAGVGAVYLLALAVGVALVVMAAARFARAPRAATARLQGPVEAFAAIAMGGLVLAVALERGVAWLPPGAPR